MKASMKVPTRRRARNSDFLTAAQVFAGMASDPEYLWLIAVLGSDALDRELDAALAGPFGDEKGEAA